MTGVSIIIPVCNAFDELKDCVCSLYSNPVSVAFEVIVVDNGSRAEVAEWLATEAQKRGRDFRFLRFEERLGFARAINAGARQARFDYLILLNSDTILGGEWLDRLARALDENPTLGIVSPVTNRCGNELQRDLQAQGLQAEDTQEYAKSIRGRRGIWFEPQHLTFFCVLLRRTLWDQLGGLDESFQTGNFEDDDFCLRARMAGYRMAVIPDAFVFHLERRSFEANGLNHGEFMARNQVLFGQRASRWSSNLRPVFHGYERLESLSVIVPVVPERAGGLGESLASLANQTLQGFETIVVAPRNLDLSNELTPFAGRLRLTVLQNNAGPEGVASLLNAGLSKAAGTEIAYLPASDVFYPFHLEVLWNGLNASGAAAVYAAWNVVVNGPTAERRGTVIFPDAEPDTGLGDWAPLLCWMHKASASSSLSFDASSGRFAPWRFLLRLQQSCRPRYICRATCERRPDKASLRDAVDAEAIMRQFPVDNEWKESQRRQFLDAVREGNWEDRLVVSRNDRVRRARTLLGTRAPALLKSRLEHAAAAIEPAPIRPAKTDVILFSSVEWTALTQRPHHFAMGLASRGHRVFWIDVQFRRPESIATPKLILQCAPGLLHLELPALQDNLYRVEWREQALDTMLSVFGYLRAAYGISTPVQLVHFPLWEPLCSALATRFGWRIVYDCLDDQEAFSELFGHELKGSEVRLIANSSAVVASGQMLLDALRERRPDAVLIPNASDFELFHNGRPDGLLGLLPRPVAGFFGAFADWLDFEWIERTAKRFPRWSFVYIGREGFASNTARQRWREVTKLPNVHVLPQAAQSQLANYLAEFDVCTMPFRDMPATRSMNAVKMYEYLAAGKPVVAAELPETSPLGAAGLIATYASFEESCRLLEKAIDDGNFKEAVDARITFAVNNTWRHRLDDLSRVLFCHEEPGSRPSVVDPGGPSWIQPTRV